MEAVLGILAGFAFIFGAIATGSGFSKTGSDIQLLLGAVFFLIGTTAMVGAAIIARMDKKT